ncbi:pentapeptide repeat-containing protein [Streptomyces cinnabarinus]|uniref:Pentapeptide repeat-containing protein n=1 Tax=Streptomyces cinnabarinus TaxID=67287 RepID=A0ABY7KT46_9ACTN|nr:pentapeptide repeat-containing protein [Streptomyces cinnabarinus]WAZ26780.1 pentapeptide repeat-containing protein [Streptomyces cinnabarinus]
MSPRLPRRQAERRGLSLWPVGIVLLLAFTAAVLVASAVFYAGWGLLDAHELKPERRIDSKTLFDLVKLAFGVVAGAGALVALVVAYRRQRVDEDGALRDATRLHTERFTTAVSQLGEESAAVRLGGVHALAGLADDAPTRELRQTCIDVLCAYLRLPYTAEADLPENDAEARHDYLALREVRHTVIRLIRDHLRLPLQHHHSWQGHDFDFTSVTFDGGDLSQTVFSGGTVHFIGATFASSNVDFSGATFSGGTVHFGGATFTGGWVDFRVATFSGGTIFFGGAAFSGGTVDFTGATFSGGTVYFVEAAFSGGRVDFGAAAFSGSMVSFIGAEFSSGRVNFNAATFSGGRVRFDGATFSGGTIDFTRALGPAPHGLIPAAGSPLPGGLALAAAWRAGH